LRDKRVAKLVLYAFDRQFLRKGINLIAAAQPHESVDVLHNASFLIVCFFNQEAVILNSRRLFLGRLLSVSWKGTRQKENKEKRTHDY